MANPTYRGPADNLIVPGIAKVYHQGDAVPLTADQRANLELNGHTFDETKDDEVAAAIQSRQPAAAESLPRGDRGEVLDRPNAEAADTATPAVMLTPGPAAKPAKPE